MPAYDFRCKACRYRFTLAYISYAAREDISPVCPKCGSKELSHLIRRVSFMSSEESRMERLADPSRLSGLDENDPRAMGRLMKEMAAESGEDLGPEMDEMVGRLESGESPESIEQSMQLSRSDMASGGDFDL